MSDLKSRLVEFARTQYNMGQNKFEDHCGISRGIINAIKDTGISTTTLTKIIVSCPRLNVRWLLLGEKDGGPMLMPESESSVSSEGNNERREEAATNIIHASNSSINGDIHVAAVKELKDIIDDLRQDKARLVKEKEEIWEMYKELIRNNRYE